MLVSMFLSDEGRTLETLDFTIRICSTPTFLYFNLYLNTAYAAFISVICFTISTIYHRFYIYFLLHKEFEFKRKSVWKFLTR